MRWLMLLCLFQPAADPVRRAADLECARAVEDWVADTDPWHLEKTIPPIVLMTGSPRRVAREFAAGWIRLGGDRYLESLVRATYHPDPEIRHRAAGLIDRLFVCPTCHGSGFCRTCTSPYTPGCPCDTYNHCLTCNGGMDLRFEVSVVVFQGSDADGNDRYITYYRRRKVFASRDRSS